MFNKAFIVFLCLIVGFNGIPVERSSGDLSQYFTQRIIGGVDAPKGYAPHMVALVAGRVFIIVGCGGSIISKKHVLTAAHCINFYVIDGEFSSNFHGRVGSNQWAAGGTKVEFSKYNIHPKYDADNIKYDIGVLIMSEELKLNEKVAIIALNYKWIGGGHKTYVTGWGVTGPRCDDNVVNLAPTPDDLQLLYVNTIDAKNCALGVKKASLGMPWAPVLNPAIELCSFHSPRHGMCNGDSGSAMVSLKYGDQIGLVSWGFPCAIGAPDIFVRISGFKDYLEFVLNKLE